MSLDRKVLLGRQSIPAEVAGLGKGSHFLGCQGKLTSPRPESSVEKFGEGPVLDRLKLAHVDVVLADKWLDLPRAPARVPIGGIEPIVKRLRFDPLGDRAARLTLVSGLVIVHPF